MRSGILDLGPLASRIRLRRIGGLRACVRTNRAHSHSASPRSKLRRRTNTRLRLAFIRRRLRIRSTYRFARGPLPDSIILLRPEFRLRRHFLSLQIFSALGPSCFAIGRQSLTGIEFGRPGLILASISCLDLRADLRSPASIRARSSLRSDLFVRFAHSLRLSVSWNSSATT